MKLPPIHLRLCYVLKLAVIHYYAENTFSYVSLPIHPYEEFLLDHSLIYIAETYDPSIDDLDLGITDPRRWARLVLTDAGKRYLERVSQVKLVNDLLQYAFSATRLIRFSPYGDVFADPHAIALKYMDDLSAAELPQFLSHGIDSVRTHAKELLDMSVTTCD